MGEVAISIIVPAAIAKNLALHIFSQDLIHWTWKNKLFEIANCRNNIMIQKKEAQSQMVMVRLKRIKKVYNYGWINNRKKLICKENINFTHNTPSPFPHKNKIEQDKIEKLDSS